MNGPESELISAGSAEQGSPVRLSLCMILRNESFFLPRCLDAVRDFVDETVLVDTGSSDDTLAICRQYTDRVFEFAWEDDFARARNFSLQQARGDWILVLDADEMIAGRDLERIRTLIDSAGEDAFFLNQLNYSSDAAERDWQPVSGEQEFGWDYSGYRANPVIRLMRNRSDIRFTGKVHEIVDPTMAQLRTAALDIAIHHDMNGNPDKDMRVRQRNYLRIMERALEDEPDGRLAARAGAVRMYILQDYRGAISHLQQAVELGYDVQRNREAIAEAWYRLDEPERALAAYSELYTSGLASASLCNNYSNLLVKSGDYALAIEVLQRALTLGQAATERIARLRHNIEYLKGRLEDPA